MVLYVDVGCSGNDQLDRAQRRMVAVVTDERGAVLREHEAAGGSNNIAELMAVRDALDVAARAGVAAVEVRTDSRNNFAWVFGRKLGAQLNDRVTVEALRHEIAAARQRITLQLTWIPGRRRLYMLRRPIVDDWCQACRERRWSALSTASGLRRCGRCWVAYYRAKLEALLLPPVGV